MKIFGTTLAGHLVLALGVAGTMAAVNPENEAAADRYDYHGFVLARTHQTEKAIQNFSAAIRTNPSDWIPYVHRAQTYLEVGQWSKAVADCNAALRIKPTQINAYIARAVALYYLGRDAESLADVATVLKAGPSDSTLRTVVAVQKAIYSAPLQDPPEVVNMALAQVTRAVERARGDKARARALNNRAWLFSTSPIKRLRNGEQALRDALESCRLTAWKQPSNIDTLAAAYAECADYGKAITAQKQAIALIDESRDGRDDYKARLSAYARHQPHRQTACGPPSSTTRSHPLATPNDTDGKSASPARCLHDRVSVIALQHEKYVMKPIRIAVASDTAIPATGRRYFSSGEKFGACAAPAFSDFLARSRLKIDRTPPL